jgi:hypothetical protein
MGCSVAPQEEKSSSAEINATEQSCADNWNTNRQKRSIIFFHD